MQDCLIRYNTAVILRVIIAGIFNQYNKTHANVKLYQGKVYIYSQKTDNFMQIR